MELLLLTLATIINLFTMRWKVTKGRYKDIMIEVGIIIMLSSLFQGTLTGMAIATSVSAAWSIYTILLNPFGKKPAWEY